MSLSEIIQVTITAQTTGVSRANFGTPGVLTHHTVFPEDYRTYTSAADMVTDGFSVDQGAYRIVNALFSQNPRPSKAIVGKRVETAPTAQTVKITPAARDSQIYTVTINGTPFSFTSDATATVAEITGGLTTAINLGSEPVTATDNTTDIDLVADVAADSFRMKAEPFVDWTVIDNSISDSIDTDVTTFASQTDDWYSLFTDAYSAAEISAASTSIGGLKKIYIAQSGDTLNYSSPTGGIADTLASDRTSVFYHSSLGYGGAAAWAGNLLPLDPGAATWAYKTLSGQLPDPLSATQRSNLEGKDANYYTTLAGVNITRFGTMSSGEYIDVTRFVDWLENEIQVRIYQQFVNLSKIPYTDPGVAIVENEIRGALTQGIANGGLAASPEPTVTVPLVADVSDTDKANRLLPDVEFQATLAGAIHTVQISGVVSV